MQETKPITLDEIYISPFTARRVYSEDGVVSWIPLKRNLEPTGIARLDFIFRSFSEGNGDFGWIADRLGCTRADMWGWARVMLGMDARDFRHAYRFRLANDLLRFTSLPISEVARRAGFSSASLMCQQYMKYEHCSPEEVRRSSRLPMDEDRFRI